MGSVWPPSANVRQQARAPSITISIASVCGDSIVFSTVAVVQRSVRWASTVLLPFAIGCGDDGVLPGSVQRGPDFNIADVVYDENYFYCVVEPMLFTQQCGSGGPDDTGGCHYSRTSYRLTEYAPLVADTCDGIVATGSSAEARQNYQASQARMNRDPELAPLLNRPTGAAAHPRVIFESTSAEADLIREWARRFSTR